MSWMPTTTGQYSATCIFLIIFATIFRALVAIRLNIIDVLAAFERRQRGAGDYPYVVEAKSTARRPWRAREAVLLASMDVILAGIGYLL
jgi:hypothetical protein